MTDPMGGDGFGGSNQGMAFDDAIEVLACDANSESDLLDMAKAIALKSKSGGNVAGSEVRGI